MMDATSSYQTILVVRISGLRPVAGLIEADEKRIQLEQELAYVQSVLAGTCDCHATRIYDEELIALYADGEAAFAAACALKQTCSEPGSSPSLLHMRILLDESAAPLRQVGKAAAGMKDIEWKRQLVRRLPPDWIFATKSVTDRLREPLRIKFRPCEQDATDETVFAALYRALWHEDATTRIAMPAQSRAGKTVERSMYLRWRGNTITLRPDSPVVTLGRADQADVRIESDFASRNHARVGFQETNFILTDQSTNGTFVQIGENSEVCLCHEQIVLRDSGLISLGRHIGSGRGKLIYFGMNS